ncbi:MAG: hypothetical protein BECKG1743F_GA0114225_106403, partial [Candidatus Kentron sp. G]
MSNNENKIIGKVTATESKPTTCTTVHFWLHHDVTSFEIRGTLSHDQAWVPDGAHGRS